MELPLGYRFRPTDKELIKYYLFKKITGEPIPHNPVKDCDVYGDPMIWRRFFEETEMKTLYFYTKLKKRQKGKTVKRAIEFGTWEGQKKISIYDDDDDDDDDDEEERDDFNERKKKHIGTKRFFTFVEKKGFEHNAGWTMHEYRLDGTHQDMQDMQNEDKYVLCQINKIKKKKGFPQKKKEKKKGWAAKDNSHHNIQVEGAEAQLLDKAILTGKIDDDSWIDMY